MARTNPLIAVVCDAGQHVGAGHVSRCLAVVEHLRGAGVRVVWFSDLEEGEWWAAEIVGRDEVQPFAEPGLEERIIGLAPDAVLLDSYVLPPGFGETAARRGIPVVAIQDPTTPWRSAAIRWAPGFPTGRLRPPAVHAGPQAVLLRNRLRRHRLSRQDDGPPSDGPWRVGVLMGGAASTDLTFAALSALRGVPMDLEVHVTAQMHDVTDHRIVTHMPSPDIWVALTRCHFLITASGVSAWEALYTGVPCGLVQTADNQSVNYWGMTTRGWAMALGTSEGMSSEPNHLASGVTHALSQWDQAASSAALAQDRIDGLGSVRLSEILIGMCD